MVNYRSPISPFSHPSNPPDLEEQLRQAQAENAILRQEVQVAHDAANITAQLVIKQFEQTDSVLQRLEIANAYLNALHETTLGLIGQLDIHELLKSIIVRAGALLKTGHGYIYLLEPDGLEMQNQVGTGVFEGYVGHRVKPGDGVAGRVWQSGKPLVVENYCEWEGRIPAYALSGLRSLMGVPLTKSTGKGETQVLGMIGLAYITEDRCFSQNEVQILIRFAALASIALLNANLYSAAQQEVVERKRAEEAAEAANRAKSNFLATMSHELRTPLNAILGFSEFISRADNLTPGQRDDLSIINQSGEHLLDIINDILEISKIEAGRSALQEEDFDLYSLLRSLENILRIRAQQHNITLVFTISPGVPRYVRTDQGKLRQVLMNLLSNAIKFTSNGQVSLTLDIDAKEPTSLWFAVEDTGVGIAPEEIDLLFNAFAQTSSGIKTQQGTGLGLVISRAFVRMLGGEITVRSQLGKGSRFAFDIRVDPLVELSTVPLPHGKQPRVLGIAPDQVAPDGGCYRMLVAEDVEANWLLMKNVLLMLGQPVGENSTSGCRFEVRVARNGQEAIRVWQDWHPHLVWMDIRMPIMDGSEATRYIKSQPDGLSTIVIALTATAFEEDRQQALSAGFDGFVRKPFREKYIVATLKKHLGIQFVYENFAHPLPPPEPPRHTDDKKLEALPPVPATWLKEMQEALLQGEIQWQRKLVEELHDQAPALSEQMAELIKNFELDELGKLIQALPERER